MPSISLTCLSVSVFFDVLREFFFVCAKRSLHVDVTIDEPSGFDWCERLQVFFFQAVVLWTFKEVLRVLKRICNSAWCVPSLFDHTWSYSDRQLCRSCFPGRVCALCLKIMSFKESKATRKASRFPYSTRRKRFPSYSPLFSREPDPCSHRRLAEIRVYQSTF